MSYVTRLKANRLRERKAGNRSNHHVGKSGVIDYVTRAYRGGMLDLVLFTGPDGVGKRFMARYAADVALCKTDSGTVCQHDLCPSCRKRGRTDRVDICEQKATEVFKNAKPVGPGRSTPRISQLGADVHIVTGIDQLNDEQQKVLGGELRDHIRNPSRVILMTADDDGEINDGLRRVLAPHTVEVPLPTDDEAIDFLVSRFEEEGIGFESRELVAEAVEAVECDPYELDTMPYRLATHGHKVFDTDAFTALFGRSETTDLVALSQEPLEEPW